MPETLPRPTTLFVGGQFDGQRLAVAPDEERLRHSAFVDASTCEKIETTYRRLPLGKSFVYVHETIKNEDLFEHIARHYQPIEPERVSTRPK